MESQDNFYARSRQRERVVESCARGGARARVRARAPGRASSARRRREGTRAGAEERIGWRWRWRRVRRRAGARASPRAQLFTAGVGVGHLVGVVERRAGTRRWRRRWIGGVRAAAPHTRTRADAAATGARCSALHVHSTYFTNYRRVILFLRVFYKVIVCSSAVFLNRKIPS